MSQIGRVSVAEDRFAREWGVRVFDYSYQGAVVDLQDIATKVTQRRALAIESEVGPMQNLITRRGQRLEKYGLLLSALTELQSQYAGDEQTGKSVAVPSAISAQELKEIGEEMGMEIPSGMINFNKGQTDGAVQRLKSLIDEANNQEQKDVSRLQALVDRRDESFTTATAVMTAISDTRGTLMKNL